MTPRQCTGRRIVLADIALTLAVKTAVSAWKLSEGAPVVPEVVHFVLLVVAAVGLWRGLDWARWLFIVLTGAVGVYGVGIGVLFAQYTAVGLGAFYLVAALALTLPAVRDFLLYRRQGPAKGEAPRA